ncbi:hypothetical protein HMPREF0645_0913 [Hallella bergensis DSM 17361]|uniref:Uncharacterized protein n=1 Tax=Hallella bergensis DSM 17361 TaxID=585502 RepID=D1PVC8_9BACT|nr:MULTISPECIES: hypothetical protein [Prevotellaceae]EFA44645.1 hypothetical protein HMPREF0645_0913 [Hallella bergensis DSM 17361]
MRQFLLILCLFLSSPLFIKGDEEFVAILYLHNGQYVSSDSVYTFFNLDGTYFDSLKSREGNEPTCSRIAKGDVVSYYPNVMIYVFFCKLLHDDKVLVRVGEQWKKLSTNAPFSILSMKEYLLSLDILLKVNDIVYHGKDKIKIKKEMIRHIIDVRGDYIAIKIDKKKMWFRWKKNCMVLPDRLIYE